MEETDSCQREGGGTGWKKGKGAAKEHHPWMQTTVWGPPGGWGGRGRRWVEVHKVGEGNGVTCNSVGNKNKFEERLEKSQNGRVSRT